jgi:hypothetical protein
MTICLRLDHYLMVLCFSRHVMLILSYNVNEYTYPVEVCGMFTCRQRKYTMRWHTAYTTCAAHYYVYTEKKPVTSTLADPTKSTNPNPNCHIRMATKWKVMGHACRLLQYLTSGIRQSRFYPTIIRIFLF